MERQNHSALNRSPLVVIGAGIGGLSAAIRLALAGERVQVFEQNAEVGGKMSERFEAGFRWDTGPSVITMRWVFEDLFAAAGRRLDDYLTFLPVDPLTRYFYPDGTVLDATRDLSRMAAQIERIEPRDVEGYLAYLSYAARLHRITGPAFVYGPPPSPASLRAVSPLDTLRFDPLRTMQQAIDSYVRDPRLRQLLGRFATYVGGSPYLAPATLNVIAHVEMTGGVWYPRGGIYAIASALERLAVELGVEIRAACPVEAVVVEGRRAAGVRLAGGEEIAARAVIANVDVARVYEKLLPAGSVPERAVRRLTGAEPSCSGYVLLLGVEGEHPRLAHHNIFFSSNYRREFDDIFRRGLPPEDPTVYVAITSKTDPTHAPPGCENWFVMVNAPATGPAFDWAKQSGAYRERVLDTLARFGLDARGRIRAEQALTPPDIERLTGARRGALYGTSSNDLLAAFRRPHNRCPHLRGLYFCGGTSHPGGGVPMVTLSGRSAARFVLNDLHERGASR